LAAVLDMLRDVVLVTEPRVDSVRVACERKIPCRSLSPSSIDIR
jgi:hypothetical protein